MSPINYDGEIDYILHLASNTHPKQYGDDPVGTIIINVIGCDNLLKLANKNKAKFLFTSSVEIYGQGNELPMDETYCGYINCNKARSGYNEAKRTCEGLCQSYKQQYGVYIVIARLSRVFGADKKDDSKAIAQFIDKAISGEDIVLKSKGTQRFSYCYIADAVSGIIKILLDGQNGEAYNVSAEDLGMNLADCAEFVAKLANKNVVCEIENDEFASKISFALMNINKIR